MHVTTLPTQKSGATSAEVASPLSRAIAYDYRWTAPMPPPADADAMACLAKARGKSVVTETESAIEVLDREIRAFLGRMVDSKTIEEAIKALPGMLERRALYRQRAGMWRRLFDMPACPIGEPPSLPSLDPNALSPDTQRFLASRAAQARDELKRVEHLIDTYAGPMYDDLMYSCQTEPLDQSRAGWRLGLPLHPQDACLEKLNVWCAQRRELASTIASLEGHLAKATSVVRAKVHAAVERAGGVESVITGAIAAAALSGPGSTWASTQRQLADAEEAVRKLTAAGVTEGPALDGARNHARDATAALATAQDSDVATRRAVAAGIVDQALAGDEAGRARLEALASSAPAAFHVTFPAAIAEARYDRAVLIELSAALKS